MRISKEFGFEASHVLSRHPGKCSRLHGHSWRLRIELEGQMDQKTNFVMDYADLVFKVDPVVEMFDHRHLNCFIRYPSAENVAIHIADLLRPKFSVDWIDRLVVAVSETAKTWAVWDSARREDILILDKAPSSAEWRSPEVPIPVTNVPIALDKGIKEAADRAQSLFEEYEKCLIKKEQLALYKASLVMAPEILPRADESLQ